MLFVFWRNSFVFVCVGVCIPEGFYRAVWSLLCVHVWNMQIKVVSCNWIVQTQCCSMIYRLWLLKVVANGYRYRLCWRRDNYSNIQCEASIPWIHNWSCDHLMIKQKACPVLKEMIFHWITEFLWAVLFSLVSYTGCLLKLTTEFIIYLHTSIFNHQTAVVSVEIQNAKTGFFPGKPCETLGVYINNVFMIWIIWSKTTAKHSFYIFI